MPTTEVDHGGSGSAAAGRDGTGFRMIGEEVLYRGWVITLTRATFRDPDGVDFDREVVRHPGAVAVVPVTDAGSVVLVSQYRPAMDRWLLEIPAGTCDVEGEPELEVARRELAEEVGYVASELTFLTRCAVTPGFCDELSAVYLATGLAPVPVDRHGIEERHMAVREVPLAQVDALVDEGAIVDATTILGLGLAARRLASGRPGSGRPDGGGPIGPP